MWQGREQRMLLAVALVFGLFGILTYGISKAATQAVSIAPRLGVQEGCVSVINDSSAYEGKAAKFNTCQTSSRLDESGRTLPDTNYAIPAGAVFMSPGGNDSGSGTQASPVKSLNRAIDLVPPGGTIVARGGTYRDWYTRSGNYAIITKGFTLQAFPHEAPWFDGADAIASNRWTNVGNGRWSMKWETPTFCDGKYYDFAYDKQSKSPDNLTGASGRAYSTNTGPCTHWDMYGSSTGNFPAAGDPQQVFVNGNRMKQVASLSAVSGGTFYYDWSQRTIYISSDPQAAQVELSARPVAMVLGTSNHTRSIKGIGFKRYATNEYENLTAAAVYMGGDKPGIVEKSVFTQNAGRGLLIGSENSVMDSTVFSFNGFNGAHYYGNATSTKVTDNFMFTNNVVSNNNLEGYGLNCSLSCAAAGIKMSAVLGFTMKGNVFKDNHHAAGAWCDYNCYDGIFVNNFVSDNKTGYDYEQNDRGIVAGNVFVNHTYAINLSSQGAKIYNNTIINQSATIAMRVYDDNRPRVTSDIRIGNNVIYGKMTNTDWFNGRYGASVMSEPSSWLTYLDYNSYWRPSGSTNWRFVGTNDEYFPDKAAIRAKYPMYEANATDTVGGSDPFFVGLNGKDYRIRTGSPAYKSGGPIPADVAAAMGVSVSSGQNRGAFTYPQP